MRDFEILNSFVGNEDQKNLVIKALSSATNVGEALSPQSLEQAMTMTIQRISPEMSILMDYGTMKQIAAKFHEYNRITSLPARGAAIGENATTPVTNSTFERKQVELKIFRKKGQVTDYVKDVSREYVDVLRMEMENQLKSLIWDMITSVYFGNATANTYDVDGLETFISTNRTVKSRGGEAITNLKFLDTIIDQSNRQGGGNHPRVIYTSPEMVSAITRYETTLRKNVDVGTGNFSQIMIPGGHRVETYRGIPLVQTTALSPIETMRPTITLSGVATGGNLSDGTYYVQIAPVTNQGEQLAKAEQSVTLSGGTGTQRIKISFDVTHKDADGRPNAYYYKIYASSTSLAEKLVKIAPQFLYDATGTPTIDNGVGAGNEIYIGSMTAEANVPAHMANDVPLVATGGISPEYLILQDLDPIQGLGKIVYANLISGGYYGGLVSTRPVYPNDAFSLFLVYTHCAIVPAFEKSSVLIRGLRVE